ncbi:hypothetical protein [Staphylococcus sp. 11261D007BR]
MSKIAKGLLSSIVLFGSLLAVSGFSDDASAITQKGYVHAANEWYNSTYDNN